MPFMINLTIGILVTLIGGLLTLAIYDYYCHRPRPRRITKPKDKDLEGFFEIYELLIPYNERESRVEIIRYIKENREDRQNKNLEYEEFFIIAKIRQRVVAFLYFTYYHTTKYAFINYLGIDKRVTNARKAASRVIIKKLKSLLNRSLRACKGIIFEIDKPNSTLTQRQRRKIQATRDRFEHYAQDNELKVYELPIEYIQPKLSAKDRTQYSEEDMLLMYVPVANKPIHGKIPKQEMMDILKATYIDWYGDIYDKVEEHRQKYAEYMDKFFEYYASSLPDEVQLRD